MFTRAVIFWFLIVSPSPTYKYGKHSHYEKTVLSNVIDSFIIAYVFLLFHFRGSRQKWEAV